MNLAIAFLLSLSGALWTVQGPDAILAEEPEFENVTVDHRGVVRLAPALDELAVTEESSIWSIVEGDGGTLYLGTGNGGRVLRLDPNGDVTTIFDAESGEILALSADNRGNIYFGVTPGGKLFRFSPGREPVELFDSETDYIFALQPGPSGNLYCATGGSGRLYRVSGGGTGTVMFSAPQAHLTSLAWLEPGENLLVGTSPDGIVYRLSLRPGREPQTSVLYDTPLDEVRAIALSESKVYIAANPGEESNGEAAGGVVYCVRLDGVLEWKWDCPDSTVFALEPTDNGLLVATGSNGMIYRLDAHGRPTIYQQTEQSQVLCLVPDSDVIWAGTAGPGAVHRLGRGNASSGNLLSPPYDCEGPAHFGRVEVRSAVPAGTKLTLDTRTGNSELPDSTWTEWVTTSNNVKSPAARFIQWRARFESDFTNLTPELERVDVYYRIPNRPPAITTLSVLEVSLRDAGKGGAKPVREVSWETEDPDGDSLDYELHFKGEDEKDWKQLAERMDGTTYELDTRTIPDGWYRFRLTTSDRAVRPADKALTSELVAQPVLIDNTPPTVSGLSVSSGRIGFRASDAASPIAGCRVSVNAGPWRPLEPADGLFDTNTEIFSASVELNPGENTVAVWIADGQGNTATARKLVRR